MPKVCARFQYVLLLVFEDVPSFRHCAVIFVLVPTLGRCRKALQKFFQVPVFSQHWESACLADGI